MGCLGATAGRRAPIPAVLGLGTTAGLVMMGDVAVLVGRGGMLAPNASTKASPASNMCWCWSRS